MSDGCQLNGTSEKLLGSKCGTGSDGTEKEKVTMVRAMERKVLNRKHQGNC